MKRMIVGMVIDASGSMQDVSKSVLTGYNEYLQTLSKEPAEIRLSQTQFADTVRVEHKALPLALVPRLTSANYIPEGSTALYDGVGETITRLEQELGREDRVLVVIMTDGDENLSRCWSKERLHAKIKEKEATGRWTFILMGANTLDVGSVGADLGILPGNVKQFNADLSGTLAAFKDISKGTQRLLTDGRDQSAQFFKE